MQKIIVSKEVKDALDVTINSPDWSLAEVLDCHISSTFLSDTRRVLNLSEGKITTEDIVKASVYGYEVEKVATLNTSEFDMMSEKDRERVNASLVRSLKARENAYPYTYSDGVYDGMRIELGRLGIEVDYNIH